MAKRKSGKAIKVRRLKGVKKIKGRATKLTGYQKKSLRKLSSIDLNTKKILFGKMYGYTRSLVKSKKVSLRKGYYT